MDANILYSRALSESLPCDETEMWHGHPNLCEKNLEGILNTPDDTDIGYFLEVDLGYPDNKEEKTRKFLFGPDNKKIIPDK